MSNTQQIDLEKTWKLVAENCTCIAIQLRQQGQAMVFISDTAPAENEVGLMFSNAQTFSAGHLPTTAKIYARSIGAILPAVVTSY